MLWLRNARIEAGTAGADTGVGIDSDIIRGATLATLLAADAACAEAGRQRDALLAQARQEADELIDAAQAAAAELIDDAQQRFELGYAQGEAAGLQHAMEDWHARSAALFVEERALFMKVRERFAAMVVAALEQLVPTLDRTALFEQAARQMDRLVDAGSALSVRVHPHDLAFARDAFDACAQRWLARGRPVTVSTLADASLAPGACVCESDLGTLDASLDTQLAALRGALERTLHALPLDADMADDDRSAGGYEETAGEMENAEDRAYPAYGGDGDDGDAAWHRDASPDDTPQRADGEPLPGADAHGHAHSPAGIPA